MDLQLAVEIYNISKFYIPQDDHYDLAKDTVRCLTDNGVSASQIDRSFSDFDEVMKALDQYSTYTQETEDVQDMDVEEYVDMEKQEYLEESFGGEYYEYLDEQ